MIYFIGDSIWALAYFNIVNNSDILIKFARMIYYIASGFIGYYWLMYVEILIGSNIVFSKKRKLLLIPVLISTIATIFICIFLNPAEKSISGYLTVLALVIVQFCYIIFAGIHTLYKSFKETDDQTKKRYRIFAIWPIIILIISLLQVFIAEIPIYCFGALFVITYLYIYNLDSYIITDPLTGINNRNMINRYIKEMDFDNSYYVLIIDIDKFKNINDTYGHIEGDRALKYMANTLKKVSANQNYFLARYGGDEFIIFAKNTDEDIIVESINKINELLKDSKNDLGYEIKASTGYSLVDDNIEKAIENADKMLYERKEIAHKNN